MDRRMVRVQEDSGCDVPGREVEQLVFGSGFDSTFGCSRAFPLAVEGKERGTPELNSNRNL